MKHTLLILTFFAVSLVAHAQSNDQVAQQMFSAIKAQGIDNRVPDYKVWVDKIGHGYVNDKSFRELQVMLYGYILADQDGHTELCTGYTTCERYAFKVLFVNPGIAANVLDQVRVAVGPSTARQ